MRPFALLLLAAVPLLAVEPFQWGVNGHPLSQEAYFHVPVTNQLDLVRELGAGWYRFDLGERQFAAQTARMDELLAAASSREIRLLPVLFPAVQARGTAAPDAIRTSTSNYARSVASRYKGRITHWELSNELDGHAMIRKGETNRLGDVWKWDGAPDGSRPEHYDESRYQQARAEILGLYEGIKAADPDAVTIVNTAGWLHHGFIERLVHEDHVPFDVLSWHWYSEMGSLTNVQGRIDLVHLLSRFGRPLTITEINRREGSKGGREVEQAAYLREVADALRAHPSIRGLHVYELLDEPYFGPAGESDYGLVRVTRDGAGRWQLSDRKPAFAAYRDAIRNAP